MDLDENMGFEASLSCAACAGCKAVRCMSTMCRLVITRDFRWKKVSKVFE
ncbi:hypothetical protein CHCC20441_0866 [Bacillus licheniformis]|uniref:Uncharacterized protein n=1 Tax=Bacillus licheniformis TaxID=1402 RepID=A0A8B5YHA9_BACLI|nr:hypothetical protein B4092_2644 [Bacillus licheniformis]TWN16197.1 hypothetical protein CHCC14564_0762 [Bacillus licheniformis LMG 17339]KYC76023.1 hypothetical protein B4090_2709 [Bacillus licheniformis]KYC81254.1 hypothetical protein B4091_3274 [Bacillus licheniformis]KYC97689.1 hypothetical protein B4164_2428 [Bacillus licheniformis]